MSVANTGPTIPPEEIQRLFQPFQRLDGQRTHHTIGHGLGLSIVRGFLLAQGGDIAVGANPGGGAVFTVYLPYEPAAAIPVE